MIKQTHIAFSVTCASSTLLLCRATGLYSPTVITEIGLMVLSGFMSLLPDVDTPNSWAGRKFSLLLFPFWLARGIITCLSHIIPAKGLKCLAKMLSHRHLTHYIETYVILYTAAIIILGFLFDWVIPDAAISILVFSAIGIVSHIFGDACFGGEYSPIVKRRIRLTPYNTGSFAETLTRFCLEVADILLIYTIFVQA